MKTMIGLALAAGITLFSIEATAGFEPLIPKEVPKECEKLKETLIASIAKAKADGNQFWAFYVSTKDKLVACIKDNSPSK